MREQCVLLPTSGKNLILLSAKIFGNWDERLKFWVFLRFVRCLTDGENKQKLTYIDSPLESWVKWVALRKQLKHLPSFCYLQNTLPRWWQTWRWTRWLAWWPTWRWTYCIMDTCNIDTSKGVKDKVKQAWRAQYRPGSEVGGQGSGRAAWAPKLLVHI